MLVDLQDQRFLLLTGLELAQPEVLGLDHVQPVAS